MKYPWISLEIGWLGVRHNQPPTLLYTEPEFFNFNGAQDQFQGINTASLCSLAARFDNPIPTRFLATIDCLKIPALQAFLTDI